MIWQFPKGPVNGICKWLAIRAVRKTKEREKKKQRTRKEWKVFEV